MTVTINGSALTTNLDNLRRNIEGKILHRDCAASLTTLVSLALYYALKPGNFSKPAAASKMKIARTKYRPSAGSLSAFTLGHLNLVYSFDAILFTYPRASPPPA